MDQRKIATGVAMILDGLGVDPNDHNFTGTPERVANVYAELFAPPETEWPVFDEKYTDMVIMKGYEFYTLCPHHLLPVRLRMAVGYIPNGKVIGASKLMRMAMDANRYPMTQEALSAAIQSRIFELTSKTSDGEAVLLEGTHGCFAMRGVKAHAAKMMTVKFGGKFDTDRGLQDRFFSLARL